MPRPHRLLRAVLLPALAASALLAAAPGVASARVPRTFMGTNLDPPLLQTASGLDRELGVMRSSGVGTLRIAIYWSAGQPYQSFADVPPGEQSRFQDVDGVPTDFSESDRIVEAAARRGMPILPTVVQAPRWARHNAHRTYSPPEDPRQFAAFTVALVHRYGPQGSFWAAHPSVPRRPIRQWQIWNEPNGPYWDDDRPYAPIYVQLLRTTRKAIKAADPGAKIVLGGLVNFSWRSLRTLYQKGLHGLFDIAAVHPYTREPKNVVKIVHLFRGVMNGHGDRRKPLVVGELSWTSAKGKATQSVFGIEVDEQGQAARLKEGYRLLAARRRSLGIRSVYWYTWLSTDRGTYSFDYAGLRSISSSGRVSPKPAFRAFRSTARQLES